MKVVYVLINTSLSMNPGKTAAQVAHAVSGLFSEHNYSSWVQVNPRAIIILDGKNEDNLVRLKKYLDNSKIPSFTYIDEGESFHSTAMAVCPLEKDSSDTKAIFGQYDLYDYFDKSQEKTFRQRKKELLDVIVDQTNTIFQYEGMFDGLSDKIQSFKIRGKGHYLSKNKRLLRDIKRSLERIVK